MTPAYLSSGGCWYYSKPLCDIKEIILLVDVVKVLVLFCMVGTLEDRCVFYGNYKLTSSTCESHIILGIQVWITQ